MNKSNREYDIIVFGAASFVGKLLCRYLVDQYGSGGDLKWAIAGRNRKKLDHLKQALDVDELPVVIADAGDQTSLTLMAGKTRVVCTTVGPYALYGSGVVKACVEAGTDYCDLTGEPQWMYRMIEAHEAQAAETGARIVHNCGFDSLPSDLGVYFTQAQAQQTLGTHCSEIRMAVRRLKGGASGGTVDSGINAFDEAKRDPEIRKVMQNPYGICPPGQRKGVRQKNVTTPEYFETAGSWLAPFIMASINTRVVHRSHALAGRPWGEDFRYDESMMMGDGLKGRMRATSFAAGLGGAMALLAVGPTRALMKRFVLPEAGDGPTPEQQEKGMFDMRFFGLTPEGKTIQTRVTGDRDPGYGSTSKMLGEAAVSLARDELPAAGGFPTPATVFGERLIERLTAHAGMTFERIS